MRKDDDAEIIAAIREARARARGYADFFGWATDRDLEELGVLQSLARSLESQGELFFTEPVERGRSNDPPDCEALNFNGQRVAFEITELVDPEAICAYKAGERYEWAEWLNEKFHSRLAKLLATKDSRFLKLKGAPYPGGYVVVVFTDEPLLQSTIVEALLKSWNPPVLKHISAAYLLLSYDPHTQGYPSFSLPVRG